MMLTLTCPTCGLADIDATSIKFCSRCGRRLVGNLADPYGWLLADDMQREAAPVGAARTEGPSAGPQEGAPVAAVGLWPRMGAWAIDMAAVVVGIIFFANRLILASPGLGALSTLLLVVFVYFTICNRVGSSAGKAALGLRVVSIDERPIDWRRATLRSIVWFVGLLSLGLGLLSIASDPKGQGWHDKLSGTMVVTRHRARPGRLSGHSRAYSSR